jgi:hypothetical protein
LQLDIGRERKREREGLRLAREKEKQPETDGDGRRDDGRWECFYYRFMWRDDWRGSRGIPIEQGSFPFFKKKRRDTLFSLFSRARAGGPFSRGTAVKKKKNGLDDF